MRKCLITTQEVLLVKGYSHFKEYKKQKAWRGKPKLLHAGGIWNHLQGFAKPPNVWPVGSRASG